MKKLIMIVSVVAGTVLGAVSCSNSASPSQVHPTSNPLVKQWVDNYGFPGSRAIQLEAQKDPAMAINDAKLILGNNVPAAPAVDVNDAYVAAIEGYLTLAYDYYDMSYGRVQTDKEAADKAYTIFLVSLNKYGIYPNG